MCTYCAAHAQEVSCKSDKDYGGLSVGDSQFQTTVIFAKTTTVQWSNLAKNCSKMSKKQEKCSIFFLLLSQNSQKVQNFAHSGPIQSKNVQKCPKNEKMLNFFYFCLKIAKKFKILRTVVREGQKMLKNFPKTKKCSNFFSFFSQNSQKVQNFSHSGPIQPKTVQKAKKSQKQPKIVKKMPSFEEI